MKIFKAKIIVRLNEDVLDPQGDSVNSAINALGIKGIKNVRQGKVFDVIVEAQDEKQAKENVEAATQKLLVNDLIESYEIELGQKT